MKNRLLVFLIIFTVIQSLFAASDFGVGALGDSYTLTAVQEGGVVKLFREQNGSKQEITYPQGIFESADVDFHNRRSWEEAGLIFNSTPDLISWNGEYWLMDNSYSLIKFDGEKFDTMRYGNGGYSAYRIKKMMPMDRYWVLIYDDAGTPNEVIRIFDGEAMQIIAEISYNRGLDVELLKDKYLGPSVTKAAFYIDILPFKTAQDRVPPDYTLLNETSFSGYRVSRLRLGGTRYHALRIAEGDKVISEVTLDGSEDAKLLTGRYRLDSTEAGAAFYVDVRMHDGSAENTSNYPPSSPVKKAAITLNSYIGLREVEFTINDNIPTFGGMYINESTSTLFVYIIAEEDAEKIAELLSPYKEEVTIQFLEGRYTFKDMMEWKKKLTTTLLIDSENTLKVTRVGIDDTKNILTVGLEAVDESKIEQLKQHFQALDVPPEAVEIVETGPTILLPKRPDYFKMVMAVMFIAFAIILLGYLKLRDKGPS